MVVVRAKKMKEAWFLATSYADRSAAQTVKRFRSEVRRDRLLMLLAIVHTLLTLLGAASERSGMDACLKVNTVKRRTHSLFRVGSYCYHCLPAMRREWLKRLMGAFSKVLAEQTEMTEIMGAKIMGTI